MDEKQGKVIDGTARARHWRRSRSGPPAGADGDSPHSEAPKSIAASLLVPADMLDGSSPTGAEADRKGPVGAAVVAERRDASADAAAFATTSHDNLFLSPDAVVAPESNRSTRARTAVLRAIHAMVARLRTVFEIRPPRPSLTVQGPRRIAFAVGVAALLALAAGIVIDRAATSSSVSRPNTHPGNVAELDRLKATVLSAVRRFRAAVPAETRARPTRARTARKHTMHKPARTHPVVTRSATAPVAPSYTPPPTPTSATSSSGASSAPASSSSGGTASPSPPATHASSTSGGSPNAFGSSGVLGPGSSPNG